MLLTRSTRLLEAGDADGTAADEDEEDEEEEDEGPAPAPAPDAAAEQSMATSDDAAEAVAWPSRASTVAAGFAALAELTLLLLLLSSTAAMMPPSTCFRPHCSSTAQWWAGNSKQGKRRGERER